MPDAEGEARRPILVVEPLGDGGIAHYTYNLVRALIAAGHQPLLYTAARYEFGDKDWPDGSLRKSLFRVAFLLIRLLPALDVERGFSALLRRIVKLVEYPFNALEAVLVARWRNIAVMHLQTVNSVDLLMVLAARLAGLKVVTTVHNVNPLHGKMTPTHRRLLQLMYDLSHRLIIHTASGKAEIMNLFGLPEDKIAVIPHGDYSFFVAEQASAARVQDQRHGARDMLFFGAIRPNKGLDVLLEAMPMIRQAHADCCLYIVGEPVGGFEPYRATIDRLGLGEAVVEVLHYVGNDEVAGFFKGALVAVLPYREITQSGVMQIAFACGTPVVASDLPGFREIIDPGVNGLLVRPDDPQALGAACCELLADPERARAMGAASRERMHRDFSWDTIARRTAAEVYRPLA